MGSKFGIIFEQILVIEGGDLSTFYFISGEKSQTGVHQRNEISIRTVNSQNFARWNFQCTIFSFSFLLFSFLLIFQAIDSFFGFHVYLDGSYKTLKNIKK